MRVRFLNDPRKMEYEISDVNMNITMTINKMTVYVYRKYVEIKAQVQLHKGRTDIK